MKESDVAYRLPKHLLMSISPETLRSYVLEHGWIFSASQAGRFDVFGHPERDLDQVLIPLNTAAPDYARSVEGALRVLSEVEERSVARVMTDLLRTGSLGYFHIPGETTRREYAVYVMVATHRGAGGRSLYVGKTGDNRIGCNPVISRVGNHLSFDPNSTLSDRLWRGRS